jgi:hypothetical protein
LSNGPQPEDIGKVPTEHAQQVAIFVWAALNFERWPELRYMFAIPNGGKRDKITAANLKAEGVKAGTSDIFLPVARGNWHGLFLELKVGKNKPTADQLDFIAAMQRAGYGAMWVVGWQQAADVIEKYLIYSL